MNKKAVIKAAFTYLRLLRKCGITDSAKDSIADCKLASEGVFNQAFFILL